METAKLLTLFPYSYSLPLLFLSGFLTSIPILCTAFRFEEATIKEIHQAFYKEDLTSLQLVDHYLSQIESLNPLLRAVVEVNPDARHQAAQADRRWLRRNIGDIGEYLHIRPLHGIPILLKDTIDTKDKLNTTAGSYALLGSGVPRDAEVVKKLREAGAIILGKASLSEWYGVRSSVIPDGWCARTGQGVNPYVESADPCGSSSGAAISVAANLAAVSLGTETDGSIVCPADYNSVVGIKPTVGLTSMAGVIPVSPRQDSIGPICRTVADAVYVLDAIVGFDPLDQNATSRAAKFIPAGGYREFLKLNGLNGKRIGVVRIPFSSSFPNESIAAFEQHISTMRGAGATIIDNLEIPNVNVILNPFQSGEFIALLAEFKISINDYLSNLRKSPVRSLAEVIAFNTNNSNLEKTKEYGQNLFLLSEETNGIGATETLGIEMMNNLSRDGFEKLMMDNELDAMVTLGSGASRMLAIGGYPAITVPAGYKTSGMPFGILFGGLKGSEPKLIEVTYGFEQATKVRKQPPSDSQ